MGGENYSVCATMGAGVFKPAQGYGYRVRGCFVDGGDWVFHFQPEQDPDRNGLQAPSRRDLSYMHEVTVDGKCRPVIFRVIENSSELRSACQLLNDRYSWRGYGDDNYIPTGTHHTTFATEIDGKIVGTMTLCIDSGLGLGADEFFSDEMRDIRKAEGMSACELKRLAFDPNVRSKEAMAGLFHLAFIYGTTMSHCTDLFIEVRARHMVFYQVMLGFEPVAAPKTDPLIGCEWNLMRLKVSDIASGIIGARSGKRSGRSLYPHFLPASQELHIRRALALNWLSQSFARDNGDLLKLRESGHVDHGGNVVELFSGSAQTLHASAQEVGWPDGLQTCRRA
jgi:hypothetical protein